MEVLNTTNYKQFKLLADNRHIRQWHVEKLAESITKTNLLALNPILVNERMEVIDGQHRLEAAKVLNTPIYYIIVNNVDPKAVQILNNNKINWTWEDYVNSYLVKGFEEYKFMVDSFATNDIPLNVGIRLTIGQYKGIVTDIKAGELFIEDKELFKENLNRLGLVSQFYDGYERAEFVKAFRVMINKPEFKWEVFLEKIMENPGSLQNCINFSDHLKQLEKIYNYKLSFRNKISIY